MKLGHLELKLGPWHWVNGGLGKTLHDAVSWPGLRISRANLCQKAAAEGTYDGCGICALGLLLSCSPIFSPADTRGAFLLGRRPAVPAIAALPRHFPAGTTLIMANQCLAIPSQLCLSASLWATFAIRSHSAALARYSSFLLIDYPIKAAIPS